MVTLVIYGMIAIALAASAGYAFLTFTSTSRQMTQLQENQVRMDTAVSALRASLLALSNDGVAYAPYGFWAAGQAYMQLPSSLGVVGASPWGQPYLYCPISQTGASNSAFANPTASSVESPTGADSYNVGLYSNTITTQGIPYVVTSTNPASISTANAPGYVAFIVSTLGPGQTMPDCSSITINSGGPTVANGSVRGVTAGFSFMQRVSASSDRMELYVGTASGDGSGRDVNNLSSMDNAMALWAALKPRLGIIYLEASTSTTSTFDPIDVAGMDIQGQNASLVVETDPNIILAGGGKVTLTLNSNLTLPVATAFQNVTITGPATITAYKPLKFRNAPFTAPTGGTTIAAYNTDVVINDSNFSSVVLYGANSRISFLNYGTGGTTFTGTIAGNDSNIDFESATPGGTASYSLTPTSSAAVITTGGNVTIGSMNTSGYAPVGGATTVTTTKGQFSINGGNLFINGNSVLTMPTGSTVSPVVVTNGSANVSGTLTANTTDKAIYSYGSNINIAGTLNANNGTVGAILAEASTMTGTGHIKTYVATNPCVEFYSTNGLFVPIYINAADSTAGGYTGYAAFTATNPLYSAQYGYPPLIDYTTSTYITGTIVPSLTSANGTDPFITGGASNVSVTAVGPAGGSINGSSAYLDPTTFEAGVRSIVNQEFHAGLNIYFTGTCGP